MSDHAQSTMDSLRAEINKISSQIENITRNFEKARGGEASEILEKLTREISSLKQSAGARAEQVYKAGQNGIEEVGEHVRRNPLGSLLIAFGAGCVISCVLRYLSK